MGRSDNFSSSIKLLIKNCLTWFVTTFTAQREAIIAYSTVSVWFSKTFEDILFFFVCLVFVLFALLIDLD